MFYLGIDQHAKQLTVNLRASKGDVLLRRMACIIWHMLSKRKTYAQICSLEIGLQD